MFKALSYKNVYIALRSVIQTRILHRPIFWPGIFKHCPYLAQARCAWAPKPLKGLGSCFEDATALQSMVFVESFDSVMIHTGFVYTWCVMSVIF